MRSPDSTPGPFLGTCLLDYIQVALPGVGADGISGLSHRDRVARGIELPDRDDLNVFDNSSPRRIRFVGRVVVIPAETHTQIDFPAVRCERFVVQRVVDERQLVSCRQIIFTSGKLPAERVTGRQCLDDFPRKLAPTGHVAGSLDQAPHGFNPIQEIRVGRGHRSVSRHVGWVACD
jgi:hypothetical protein